MAENSFIAINFFTHVDDVEVLKNLYGNEIANALDYLGNKHIMKYAHVHEPTVVEADNSYPKEWCLYEENASRKLVESRC